MRKLAAVAVIGLTALGGVAATTQEAEARSRGGAALAAGVIGLAAGAIIASSAANAHSGYGYAPAGYGYAPAGYAYDYGYQTHYAPVATYRHAAPVYYAAPRVIVRQRHVAPRRVVHRHYAPHRVVHRHRHVVRHGYPVRARTIYRGW